MKHKYTTEWFELDSGKCECTSYKHLQQYQIVDSTMINQCVTLFICSTSKNIDNET